MPIIMYSVYVLYTAGTYENLNMVQAFIDILLELIISMVMGVIIFIIIPVVLSKYYRKGMMMRKLRPMQLDYFTFNIISGANQVVIRCNIMTSFYMMILVVVVTAILIASIKLTEVAEEPLNHRTKGITARSLDENEVAEGSLHYKSSCITAKSLDKNIICK